MPNAIERANARTLPIDRRTALGGLTFAGACLAVPALAALAEHADTELLGLVRRVKALDSEYEAAFAAMNAAYDRTVWPLAPPALIVTARDKEIFARFDSEVGGPFVLPDVKVVRIVRETIVELYKLIDWGEREPKVYAR